MYNTRQPTGTPKIPENQQRSKDIQNNIIAKMDMRCDVFGDLDIDDVMDSAVKSTEPD